ncbi:Hypothetical protein MexAM1_META2p0641 (plasmid) [Methylorubrum extorquens AM1]|uniref:Uncharacterized protein n=1 Tax=Methylorubrum extorquens (strain ATCC 14718 / DSM 1338 / JCM 2805 / NCIMB 9133 / AM1) TaxID=272630 RepID=C5B4V5_METEA|nr:Hypothetical protein MexAM1_META2p0641 [Methylorubrum extorquens AM1]
MRAPWHFKIASAAQNSEADTPPRADAGRVLSTAKQDLT